jgi:hypothetical protein
MKARKPDMEHRQRNHDQNVKAVNGTSEFCRELALAHVRYLLSGLRVLPLRSRQTLHLY